MNQLTVTKQISLGFGLLLILVCGLGGVAIWDMRKVDQASEELSKEFVPEAQIAHELQASLSRAALGIRTYSYTGDVKQLDLAKAGLKDSQEHLAEAEALVQRYPTLVKLKQDLKTLAPGMVEYAKSFALTEQKTGELEAIRETMNKTATLFSESMDALEKHQAVQLHDEIASFATVEALKERLRKVELVNSISALGTQARLANFKSQALRDRSYVEKAVAEFETMKANFEEAAPLMRKLEDKEGIEKAKVNAAAYENAIRDLLATNIALDQIAKERWALTEKLGNTSTQVASTGLRRAVDASEESSRQLNRGILVIVVGLSVAFVLGIGVALKIVRQISGALGSVAGLLDNSSQQVAAAAGQVSAASQTLSQGATEQAASLEETSASLEEMASMCARNADNAGRATELAKATREVADSRVGEMERLSGAMGEIQKASDNIAKIIKTIDEIAFQTNILALNAAVEAARAGEAGMGFAVVADEVRNLAQRSALAAKETASMIEDCVQKSEGGVAISAQVASGLQEIVAKVRQVDELIAEIATASREQSQGIQQVNAAMAQLDKVTQSNAASAEESASSAEELSGQALALQDGVGQLRELVDGVHDDDSQAGPKGQVESRLWIAPMRRDRARSRNAEPTIARSSARIHGTSCNGSNARKEEVWLDHQ